MTPFIIGNIQFTFSLIIYTLVAIWYINPKLKAMERRKALVPLLLIHCFRYGPLTLLMPGQVSEMVPVEVAQTIAYGDLISATLALIAVMLVWYKVGVGKMFVWLFTLVGFADVALASATGIGAGLLDMEIGFNLYILNFYVPMLIVSHILIIKLLLKK